LKTLFSERGERRVYETVDQWPRKLRACVCDFEQLLKEMLLFHADRVRFSRTNFVICLGLHFISNLKDRGISSIPTHF